MPVCTPNYAQQQQLIHNPGNLRYCTLLHDRRAWSNDSGTDEWFSWAQQFAIELPQSSGIGFDRSDLAVIAAMNDVGVAMGRKRLVQKRLESGELYRAVRRHDAEVSPALLCDDPTGPSVAEKSMPLSNGCTA